MTLGKALPYGLRDVKLIPLTSDGVTRGTAVDLPVSRKLKFSEAEDFAELRGDDAVQASHGSGPTVNWELEAGGISLEAYAVMAGGTVTSSGVSPNQIKTYRKLITDSRPYFLIEGQSINDNGGDTHGVVYRAKADGALEGEMADANFLLTAASGKGYGSNESGKEGRSYDFVQNETVTSITGAVNELQLVTINATSGTFTLTFSGQTTAAIAFNASHAVVEAALEALSNIAPGDVSVSGAAGGPYTVEFMGTLANANQPVMTADATSLAGGAHTAVVTTVREGASS